MWPLKNSQFANLAALATTFIRLAIWDSVSLNIDSPSQDLPDKVCTYCK